MMFENKLSLNKKKTLLYIAKTIGKEQVCVCSFKNCYKNYLYSTLYYHKLKSRNVS